MKWLLDLLGINGVRSSDELEQAVEHVVEGIEPRLRLVPGYRRKLLSPLQKALSYIDQTVDRIPGPLALDRQAYVDRPELKAFFASPDELENFLRNSSEVSAFLHQVHECPPQEAYALLCTNKEEKNILGMALAGNDIQREVSQTAINFYDHQLLAPATDEQVVRSGIKQCIFDGLITYGLQHIAGLKSQRRELEDHRRILHARLRARQAAGNGLSSLLASVSSTDQQIEEIAGDLRLTEDKLHQLPASEHVLDDYLAEIQQILNKPEAFIEMNIVCLHLNRMGIKVDTDSTQAANTVCFAELNIAQVLKRVVTLVRFPCTHYLT
jgi:hypothetical protein